MNTYIIRAGESGPVKIGRATNVRTRMNELQTGNHEELRLLRELEGNCEQRFHRRFAHLRIRGEWFSFDPAMLTFTPPAIPADVDMHTLETYRRLLAEAEAA